MAEGKRKKLLCEIPSLEHSWNGLVSSCVLEPSFVFDGWKSYGRNLCKMQKSSLLYCSWSFVSASPNPRELATVGIQLMLFLPRSDIRAKREKITILFRWTLRRPIHSIYKFFFPQIHLVHGRCEDLHRTRDVGHKREKVYEKLTYS